MEENKTQNPAEAKPEGHHKRHLHRHGHDHARHHEKAEAMKKAGPDSLMGLMMAFGHKIHHMKIDDLTDDNLFSALSPEEQDQLKSLLIKAKDGWKKPEPKPAAAPAQPDQQ